MAKSIVLKITGIKYKGDSIGDDIRVEVEAMGRITAIDKQIKVGANVGLKREIFRFETDQKTFETSVKIAVIEKDLLFNEVGAVNETIKIDIASAAPQEFLFKVQIRENRSALLNKFWGKIVAVFEITLTVEVLETAQYVSNEGDGWLRVVLEDGKEKISLPAFLKIKSERIDVKREYFMILEGAYRGKRASVALKDNGSFQFTFGIAHEPMANVRYSISQKTLFLNGKKYEAADYPNSPWRKGAYDIEIPDYPHPGGARYQQEAPRAKTWFRVGHSGERYLHAGGRSLGCITIIEISRWGEIYNSLIKARKGDSASVGVLEVID